MVGTTDHDLLVGVSVPRGSLYASIMQPGKHITGRATRALPAAIILAKGAECREQTHPSVFGRKLSLDIPFYRTRRRKLRQRDACRTSGQNIRRRQRLY